MTTGKYADAGYVTFFDKDEVNIYDMNNTTVTVWRGAVLTGWQEKAVYGGFHWCKTS